MKRCRETAASRAHTPKSILKICELYLASPLACVAGVTGGDLKRRIEAIMRNRAAHRVNYAKKATLAVVEIAAVVTPMVVGITNTPAVRAQSSPPPSAVTPRFEVASIKACNGEPAAAGRGQKGGNGGASSSWGLKLRTTRRAKLSRMRTVRVYAGKRFVIHAVQAD